MAVGFVVISDNHFSLSYRAPDRTLNDEEVERVHGMVRDTLVQKGYNMR